MTAPAARIAAAAEVVTGWLMLRHPGSGLRLLGHPQDTAAARAVLRVLGTRQLLQGTVIGLRPTPALLRGGAAADACHALTCLGYARWSVHGRRAGTRDAALVSVLALAQLLAARELDRSQAYWSGPSSSGTSLAR